MHAGLEGRGTGTSVLLLLPLHLPSLAAVMVASVAPAQRAMQGLPYSWAMKHWGLYSLVHMHTGAGVLLLPLLLHCPSLSAAVMVASVAPAQRASQGLP
jgi:hypothetical protein